MIHLTLDKAYSGFSVEVMNKVLFNNEGGDELMEVINQVDQDGILEYFVIEQAARDMKLEADIKAGRISGPEHDDEEDVEDLEDEEDVYEVSDDDLEDDD